MFSAFPVIALLTLAAPSQAATEIAPTTAPDVRTEAASDVPAGGSAAPQSTYSPAQVEADLTTLLTARGRDYLDARARLEAAPTTVAPRVAARLAETSPALAPAERQRLLALLGAFGRPEDLRAFADELRRDVAAATPGQALSAAEPWRQLLKAQGLSAAPILGELAADRDLDEGTRALLLGDLIDVLPTEQVAAFVAMVGDGPATLRQALRQALIRRGRDRPDDRASLIESVDKALTEVADARKPALLGLRATLGELDPEFLARLASFAESPKAPFIVRVASLRLLAPAAETPAARGALTRLATANLSAPQRSDQASELLGWIALRALPDSDASQLVSSLGLLEADEPRIAAAAFTVAPLPSDGSWLASALDHPWPEVRKAAIRRVDAPCSRDQIKRLGSSAAPPEKRGESDDAVAREALRALGRCASPEAESALIRALNTKISTPLRRSEAAKQLLLIGRPKGDKAVAKAIETLGDPSLVRRLVEAARASTDPTPALIQSLCQVSADFPALRSTVAETLRLIAPGSTCSQG